MDINRFEKFEEYLNGSMSREEKALFEASLLSDEALATDFWVYRTIETEMRNNFKDKASEKALRGSLQTLNSRYFNSRPQRPAPVFQLRPKRLYQMMGAIAAGIALILVAYVLFLRPGPDIRHLANDYFHTHLAQLSQTMGTSGDGPRFGIAADSQILQSGKAREAANDSLQLGIAAYNDKEYQKALQYFQALYRHHPDMTDAKRNIGLVYLATQDYDKALHHFDQLADLKDLHSNPGLFLQAVTFMQRNREGDRQKARQLLRQVVAEKAEGSREAEAWLKKF